MATLDNSTATVDPLYCKFKEDFKYILLPVSYALVFVFGLALNGMALYVIVFRTKTWKPSTVYMFNLTMCDTLYILTLPFLIYYYADENDWPFTEPLCKIIRFLFYANLYGIDHTQSRIQQQRSRIVDMENIIELTIVFPDLSGSKVTDTFLTCLCHHLKLLQVLFCSCAVSACIALSVSATRSVPSTGSVHGGQSSSL